MNVYHYIATVLTVIAVMVAVLVVFLALALWHARRAAKSLETLANRLGSHVDRLEGVAGALGSAALAATGRWGRTAAMGMGLVSSIWDYFKRPKTARRPSGDDEPL